MQQDRGARRDIERLHQARTGDGDDGVAGGKRRVRQSMLLVAEHQGQRLFGPQYFLEWLALPRSSADHAIAAAQPLQRVRKPDSAIELYILHSALSHAIARVRRSGLRRMVRE